MEIENAMQDLVSGMEHEESVVVDENKTAAAYGSGDMDVYATPAMIALMEQTCMKLVAQKLSETHSTVGTSVDIKHIKATPVKQHVRCKALLEKVDGPKLTFTVEAYDDDGKIGFGTHKRFVVKKETFLKNILK
jgi:predicted thioesterase